MFPGVKKGDLDPPYGMGKMENGGGVRVVLPLTLMMTLAKGVDNVCQPSRQL